MEIIEKAPAKINLGLNVIGKRADGYHELDMIMTNIDLSDKLIINELDEDVIKVSSNSGNVPQNSKNHAYKAARLIKNKFKIKKGLSIHIEKNIPVAAGLAGGSSDAAATLRALNKLWNLNLDLAELAKIGEEVGSDVPFCVYGVTSRVSGRGEIVEPITKAPKFWLVIVKPNFGVSTPSIFKKVELDSISHPDINKLQEAIDNQDINEMNRFLGNSLEDVTEKIHPDIRRIKKCLEDSGAEGVLMSGSGPTVFAVCSKKSRADRVFNSIKGFCNEVYLVRNL